MNRDYSRLDDAICEFLAEFDGHPTNNSSLVDIARTMTTGGTPWRLIDARIQAMRKAGRIKWMGQGKNNPSGRSHGWIVIKQDQTLLNVLDQ